MSEYRVLVCGGRTYARPRLVFWALDVAWMNCEGNLVVIEGGARGADKAARDWAVMHEIAGVIHEQYKANWSIGRRAGNERNTQMLVEGKPDLVIAFPGGKGTMDMTRKARLVRVPVVLGESLNQIKEAVCAPSPR